MKITSVKAFPINIPLVNVWDSSYGSTSELSTNIIVIQTNEGIFGVGEATSILPTGMGISTVGLTDLLNNYIGPSLIEENPHQINKLHEKMGDMFLKPIPTIPFMTAISGIDMALHDIVGKSRSISAVELIGGRVRDKVPIGASASLASPSEMAAAVKKNIEEEWGRGALGMKMKVGGLRTDITVDIERVKLMREAVGDDLLIIVDVNQGYSPSTAIRMIKKCEKYDPIMFEQPTGGYDLKGLVRVAKSVDAPIIADEAVFMCGLVKLLGTGVIDYFNIKPMKSGGLSGAMNQVHLIEMAGLKCTIDQTHETSIGITTMVHVASAVKSDTFMFCPSFGVFSLQTEDVNKSGGAKLCEGYVLPAEGPGLGLELKDEYLRKATR